MPVSYGERAGKNQKLVLWEHCTCNTSFVGLAGDQFPRYLGEKAFSYCGEKDENPCEARRPCAREMMTRHSSLELRTKDLNRRARL